MNRMETTTEIGELPTVPQVPASVASRIFAQKNLLTAEEVAGYLHLSRKHIFRMAKVGRIPSVRIGGSVRFDPRKTGEWLKQNYLQQRPARRATRVQ
jgi:excisionase family DNA binding protein